MRVISIKISGTLLIASAILMLPLSTAVAEDQTVNRMIASQCAQCHGTNGYARGSYPDLGGDEAKDLADHLYDMKGEDRPSDIMDHQALGYTDDQIRRIAQYYSTLPENGGD
ncbi:hypothetical protein [uncultured Amphritea sp.]|uniref:c-type cytochrome n=1 Tax=uncultured Amphritea sp. TaxID=981605 RepID=UPI0026371A5D|nr:hypothetical protein [uncultured Amphritea sp.]